MMTSKVSTARFFKTLTFALRVCLIFIILHSSGCKKSAESADAELAPTRTDETLFNSTAESAAAPAAESAEPENTAAISTPNDSASPAVSIPPSTGLAAGVASQAIAGRKFLRTADARFQVKDVYQSTMALETAALGQGGFVEKSTITVQTQNTREVSTGDGNLKRSSEYVTEGALVLRIPSHELSGFLRILQQHIQFLDNQNFNAEDVALKMLREELARRRNNDAANALNNPSPKNQIEATITRNDLRAVRDEALLSRKELEDRVAFSTLTLSLYQAPKIYTQSMPDLDLMFRQIGPSYWVRLWQKICIGWDAILELTLYIAVLWPFLLLIGAIVLLARKFYLKKNP